MDRMFFCNIGWMSRYEGLSGKPDKIVGGGKYVSDNDSGGEVCNFLIADDGMVYGYVETFKNNHDRKIRLEAIGGQGDRVDGVDVVWTATDPQEKGRRVVGWYRNATVFRERQEFSKSPSKQHAKDELTSFHIRARSQDVVRLDIDERELAMGKGPGWMGQTPWWTPPSNPRAEVQRFLSNVRALIDGRSSRKEARSTKLVDGSQNSPAAPADPYVRYVQAYEIEITPRHNELQARFETHLKKLGVGEMWPDVASVDLRYRDPNKGLVLAEVKPCDKGSVRYAIRTAIGQLFDYRQRTPEKASMLVVLDVKPNNTDKMLAISNGFAVAYPSQRGFQIVWPE